MLIIRITLSPLNRKAGFEVAAVVIPIKHSD